MSINKKSIKKHLFVLSMLFLYNFALRATVIKDIEKPYGLYVGEKKIFIYDGSSYSYKMYSLSDLKKIGNFGRKGEGPGEFRGGHEVTLLKNEIIISGAFSIFNFSKEGKLLKQIKTPHYVYFKPVKNNYVGEKIEYKQKELKTYYNVNLYNKKLEIKKMIYKQFKSKMVSKDNSTKQDMIVVRPTFRVQTFKDKIFIADCRKGFNIDVFNSSGNKIYTIFKKLQKIKITQKFRDKVMKGYKRSKFWIENRRKFNYIFPKYFSDIKTFIVADSKIYIITYLKKKGNNQLLILDIKGKLLKEMFIPFKGSLYDFKNNNYYYLEDIDEEWRLNIINCY